MFGSVFKPKCISVLQKIYFKDKKKSPQKRQNIRCQLPSVSYVLFHNTPETKKKL